MNKILTSNWTALAALIVVYLGFRMVTQMGQAGFVIQNDGYAVTGGLLILVGGVIFGMHIAPQSKKRGKN